tara:strand:+ start:210 stop:440 length:231 start_codon:yes stop_codon:yes gene_type:complete
MTDLVWEHYAEQKREEMLDEIYESLPRIHANRGNLELKSVINYVDANYDDWERFMNKEDITEIIQEYMANLTSKFN